MVTLALIRHAKSDWDDPSLSDHDRPLNPRGRRDAPRMAALVAARAWRPELILASTAVRARTTAAEFAAALDTPLELREELYGASSSTLWSAAVNSGVSDVVVVAHDPGISILARELSEQAPLMPTCAVAVFEWHGADWSEAANRDPDVVRYDIPRDES
ncbi:SixA phosphatase family protein [Microbacterium sp. ZW T5_56]|uniref:SixA phosphatase family protein n=1 Tax=Microbacterium sp. ZW T5_56 TaxID=3378081 RepID=UPI003852DC33